MMVAQLAYYPKDPGSMLKGVIFSYVKLFFVKEKDRLIVSFAGA